MDTDTESPQKTMDKEAQREDSVVLPKPSVVSPLKDGKSLLGFQGFRLVNSNKILFKKVDVKTSLIKLKSTSQQPPNANILSGEKNDVSLKKLSTADALKQIREKFKSQTRSHADAKPDRQPVKKPGELATNGLKTNISKQSSAKISLQKEQKEILTKIKDDDSVTEKTVPARKERYQTSNKSLSNDFSHKQSINMKSRGRSRSPRRDKGSCRESSSSNSKRRSSYSRNRSPERSRHAHMPSHKEREHVVSRPRSRICNEHRSRNGRRASEGDEKQYKRSPKRSKSSTRHSDSSSQKSDSHLNNISSLLFDYGDKSIDAENIPAKSKEKPEGCFEKEQTTNLPQTGESEEYVPKIECTSEKRCNATEEQGEGLFSKLSSTFLEYSMEVNDDVYAEKSQSINAADIENTFVHPDVLSGATEPNNVMAELKQTELPLHTSPEIVESQLSADERLANVSPPEQTGLKILHESTSFIHEKAKLDSDNMLVPSPGIDDSNSDSQDVITSGFAETAVVEGSEIKEAMNVSIPTFDDIKPDSKIPALASKLKNVFKSILQTDFNKATTVENLTDLTKANGILQKVSCIDEAMGCSNQEKNGITEESSSINDCTDKMQVISDAPENYDADAVDGPAQESTTNHDTSPDKLSRVSSHSNKLKLHATTNTPLPAKKSYIKQVQNDSETTPNDVSDHVCVSIPSPVNLEKVSITPRLSSEEESDAADVVASKVSSLPTHEESTSEHSVPNDHFTSNKVNMGPADVVHSDLLRQDSSGSSTNDNDDGPRRSARIRTKKSEKSLHKMLIKSSQNTSERQTDNSPNIDQASENAVDMSPVIIYKHSEIERSVSEDMSKEDIFRARVNVAKDITGCPDLFELLDENLYLTAKKKSRARKEIRRMVCDCALEETSDPDGPCGGNCLNRLLMIECSSRCHYGDRCTNKRFQHRIYAPTEVFETSYKGWGIRAAADIRQGQLVMEYCGEVVDQRGFTKRSLEYSKSNHAHFYFMALSQDEVIDATYKGNSSRFINHSCDPNAETQKWTVNGRLRVGFFTLRDIEKGEEITFDYQFERYGKVAQKCFCGTTKCRGYLGKAPDDEKDNKLSKLLSNEALSPDNDEISGEESDGQNNTDKDRKSKKKKMALFTDDTMEKDISRLLGGLRSSKEVLALSRLMVRCDTHSERVLCLRVLKETTSQTRLKTFLQFHGLSIIWSWMVDVSGTDGDEAHSLKLDIINTLCMLPITNRNVIEDSKVLSVVRRWAKQEIEGKLSPETENEIKDTEKKESENGTNETDTEKETTEVQEKEPIATIVAVEDQIEETDKTVTKELPSDVEGVGSTENLSGMDESEAQKNEKVVTAATSLLDLWKDLREIYRIPKRQKPVNSPDPESRSRDNSLSRTSSPLSKHSRHDDYDHKSHRTGRSRRNSSQERWRECSDRSWDSDRNRHRDRRNDYSDNRYSPGSSHSNENRSEAGRRKRRFSTDSDEFSRGGRNVPWHCRPPRNSRFETRMSRQEYRKRFEKDMQKREQEKKRRVEERDEPDRTPNSVFSMNSMGLVNGYEEAIPPLMGQDVSMMGQNMTADATTFTSSGYSGNLIQINPTQPITQLISDPYMNVAVNPQMGIVNQVIQPQSQASYGVQMPVQQGFNINALYSQDPNGQMGMSAGYVDPNMQQLAAVGQQLLCNTVTMMQQQQQQVLQQQNIAQQQQTVTIPQQQQQSSNVTIIGSQNGQAIVLLTAEQLQKLTQGNLEVQQQQPQKSQTEPLQTKTVEQVSTSKQHTSISQPPKPESSKKSDPDKLPPNWKTATDPEGKIYYYHIITRQTQWDAPTWDGKEEDMVGKKEAEMDLSSTPTHDERLRKTSNVKGEKITEEGQKAKKTFRLKLGQFVVQCLSQFRKSDTKVGRITSTEDFKYLARKLTHNVMMKEIKQVRVWEDLDFNTNVRYKTKDYVKKYMRRVGPVYQIRDDNLLDPI